MPPQQFPYTGSGDPGGQQTPPGGQPPYPPQPAGYQPGPQPQPGQPVLPGQGVPAPIYAPQPGVPTYVPPPQNGQTLISPVPPPPPRPTSPYDFFMEQNQPVKKAKTLPGGNIIWMAGGGVLLIVILTIAIMAQPKAVPKTALTQVAKTQSETLRLCSGSIQKVKAQQLKNFTAACSLSMTSQRSTLTTYLAKTGIKLNEKSLGQSRNAEADKRLKAATASSNYDEVYREIITVQLDAQSRSIKLAAADALVTADERKLLNDFTDQSALLRQQLDQ